MAIRLVRAARLADGTLDVVALRGLMHAHVPVGRCGCGGRAYAVDLTTAARRDWCTARCDRCEAMAAASTARPTIRTAAIEATPAAAAGAAVQPPLPAPRRAASSRRPSTAPSGTVRQWSATV